MPRRPRATPPAVASILGAALLGAGPYREDAFLSDGRPASHATGLHRRWGDFAARQLRYAVLWGHYEGSVYRNIHTFAQGLKDRLDLYEFIRPIFNPAYRDVEFWAQHLMGGMLDRDAGDGMAVPSAVPIHTENDLIRGPIAQMWRASNWQARKDTWTRFGAAMGDAPLMVVDDPGRLGVYLKAIHPGMLRECDRDDYGNVKGYAIDDWRVHPDSDPAAPCPTMARYTETCERVGESITYTTYLDGEPYDWRDYSRALPGTREVGPTWTEQYGFVPLVLAQHRDMGLGWGMAEMHPSLGKLHELDDVSSKLDDAIRKAVNPRWLLAGMDPGDGLKFDRDNGDDDEDGVPERDALDSIYATDPTAHAQPLVVDLSIAESSAHVLEILAGIERDHPEMTADRIGENASGRARKVAVERIEAMVVQRRAGYDDALARAHMMGISIGAIKGYPGFEGFTAESFDRGDLEHSVGDRPVFAVDEMDHIEEAKARADVFKVLVDGGMPLDVAMEQAGYDDEMIAKAVAGQAKAEFRAAENQRRLLMGGEQPGAFQ